MKRYTEENLQELTLNIARKAFADAEMKQGVFNRETNAPLLVDLENMFIKGTQDKVSELFTSSTGILLNGTTEELETEIFNSCRENAMDLFRLIFKQLAAIS